MKKFVGLFLSLALMVSATAVTASASEHHAFSEAETEELRAQITAQAVVDSVNATDEVIMPDYFVTHHEECDHGISQFAACNHVGTERTTKFVGPCFCGQGFVYEVRCKPCGAFIGGMCTNPGCTHWK